MTKLDYPTIDESKSYPCLYRLFNAQGDLLYVGQSVVMFQRLIGHRQFPWYHEISTIKIEHKSTFEEAFTCEKKAIQEERPKYNKVHNGGCDYVEGSRKALLTRQANEAAARERAKTAEMQVIFHYIKAQLERRNQVGDLWDIQMALGISMTDIANIIDDRWGECSYKVAIKLHAYLKRVESLKRVCHASK